MKQKNFIIISVLLLVFVIVWIAGSIYHILNKSTISETVSQDILPISPNFDVKTIDMLKTRSSVNPSFELVAPSPSPSPTTKSASSSGSLIEKSASQGGKFIQ